jgi:hypothetical protein
MSPRLGNMATEKHGRGIEWVSLVQRHAGSRHVDKVPEDGGGLGVVQGRVGGRGRIRLKDVVHAGCGEGPHGRPVRVERTLHPLGDAHAELVGFEMGKVDVGKHLVVRVPHGCVVIRLPVPILDGTVLPTLPLDLRRARPVSLGLRHAVRGLGRGFGVPLEGRIDAVGARSKTAELQGRVLLLKGMSGTWQGARHHGRLAVE